MRIKLVTAVIITSLFLLTFPVNSIQHFKSNESTTLKQPIDILFSQTPRDPEDNDKNSYTSDSGTYNFKVYENFWDLTNNISKINWYGFCMKWEGFGWKSYDPQDLKIDIIFYFDYNNTPANETYSYVNADFSYSGTGIFYEWFGGDMHEMLLYEYSLDTPINLTKGWISIQSAYHPNGASFLWMNSADGDQTAYQYQPPLTKLDDDLAYKLSDQTTVGPDLQCHGSLSWSQIPAGSLQNGTFILQNNGAPYSKLNWEINSHPEWGTWTFIPESGYNLTPESGPQTITVHVIAPQKSSQTYTGDLIIVNTDNPTDFEKISVSLSTPKIRKYITHTIVKTTNPNNLLNPRIK
jgi:hypothetical protein